MFEEVNLVRRAQWRQRPGPLTSGPGSTSLPVARIIQLGHLHDGSVCCDLPEFRDLERGTVSTGFAQGEQQWRAGLGTLRQVVRQEAVTRQLAVHLPDVPPRRVLDIGCGQGTQAVLLARRGHFVTGLDSSAQLLDDFRESLAAEAVSVRDRVQLVRGEAAAVADLFAPLSFDAVLCQGVLMYFADPGPLLDAIARVVAPGGIVSLLVRNGDALAMRPGLLGDWDTVGKAFDGFSYQNRIGLQARADRLQDLTAALARRNLAVTEWYGVRVFTDIVPSDAPLPDEATLTELLRCEDRASRTDPYRQVAALLHLIAVRGQAGLLT
jgi:SAM-dependent methyltransferase